MWFLVCDETALTERQQRLQVLESNWVRGIAGVKRMDIRMTDELREKIGVQISLTGDWFEVSWSHGAD